MQKAECRMQKMFHGMGRARNGARTAQRTVPTGGRGRHKAEGRMQNEEDVSRDGAGAGEGRRQNEECRMWTLKTMGLARTLALPGKGNAEGRRQNVECRKDDTD